MSLTRTGGVKNAAHGFVGSWEILDAFVDPMGENTKIEFGSVKEGALTVGRELFNWQTNETPRRVAGTVTTSINMAFTGQNEELTAGILHMQIGDARIDDVSTTAYVGDIANDPYFSLRGERHRGVDQSGTMTFFMYKAQAGADFELGSGDELVTTPLTINALTDNANEFNSGGGTRLGWINITG